VLRHEFGGLAVGTPWTEAAQTSMPSKQIHNINQHNNNRNYETLIA